MFVRAVGYTLHVCYNCGSFSMNYMALFILIMIVIITVMNAFAHHSDGNRAEQICLFTNLDWIWIWMLRLI